MQEGLTQPRHRSHHKLAKPTFLPHCNTVVALRTRAPSLTEVYEPLLSHQAQLEVDSKHIMAESEPIPTEPNLDPENFDQWSAIDLAAYLKKCGLGDYSEAAINQSITGAVAARLSERDLKELGIEKIGERKRFTAAIETVQKQARKAEREKTIWEGKEKLYTSCFDMLRKTMCGCNPQDAAKYKLTGTHLTIETPDPNRCGPITCCCGHEYDVDNVDLTYITDADIKGEAPPCIELYCCCGKPRDHIVIKSSDGMKELILKRGEGATVSKKIMNQVEEAQITIRAMRR